MLWVTYPEVKLPDHVVILFLFFQRAAAPVHTPAGVRKGPGRHTLASTRFLFLSLFLFFSDWGHPDGCEVVSPCGFDVRFPND